MLTRRIMSRFQVACAGAALLAATAQSPAIAQNSVTVQGTDPFDWRKLPQKSAEGIAGRAPCGWLIINTGADHLIFHEGQQYEFRAPKGKHFVNFNPCMNYKGFRVRVTYTKATGHGYDGDFRVLEILEAVSPDTGDDVPKFADGPEPPTARSGGKPPKKWEPPSKPWASAEGTVKDVACRAWDMRIVLDKAGFTLTLHTDNYMALPFYAAAGSVREGFDPCRELKGHAAKAEYAPVKTKTTDGELASIEIE